MSGKSFNITSHFNIFSVVLFPQGLFMFILHVLRNTDVRAEFDRKKQKWKTSRNLASLRSTQQHPSEIKTWANKGIKSDTYELDHKPKEATYRPGSAYDNPFVLHKQKDMIPVDT